VSLTGRGIFVGALSDLRTRWLLVATLGAAAAGVAAGFAFTAAKRYEATATIVVAPVSPSDPTLLGIDVLHDTQKRTAAATAARLVASPEVAEAVRVRLGVRSTRDELLSHVTAHVAGDSQVVGVTVTDPAPARAAQLANGFVDAFLTARTAGYQSEIQSAVQRVQRDLTALPPNQRLSPQGARLQQRLAELRILVGTTDPTVRHGSQAVAPSAATWPHPVRWTIWGALIGLGAGALLALALGAVAAARREDPVGVEEYDPRVSEKIVARLEQRLAERVDALAAERERLAAREASLAAREREVVAKLAELRAAVPAAEPARSNSLLLEADQRLAEREAELERRERALREAPEPAPSNSLSLDAEQRLAEREAELERRERELEERVAAVEERVAALSERERTLARSAAEVRQLESTVREAEANLARRAHDVTAREAELAAAPAPEPPSPAPGPAAAPPAVAAPAATGEPGWRLAELEHLVEASAAAHPERVPEWQSYLFYLRDYTDADGRVPAQFDWLIEDTFGDLLAATR
jgi:capsular polysaccharide biosynthesis protein